MDIVNPNGEPLNAARQDDPNAQAPVSDKKEEQEQHLSCSIDKNGWMTIRANLAFCSQNEDLFCLFRGFMDQKLDEAMAMMRVAQQEREKQAGLIKVAQQKNGFNKLLNKVFKR